jgi:rhodanese-related sulfurtransferase
VRAQDLGYFDVYVMPDGIAGWEKAKLPVEAGPVEAG